jgi:hypothetical protein
VRLRVATWNTGRHSPAAKLDHLAHLSPDVAVLPEFDRLPMTRPDGLSSFVELGQPGEFGIGAAGWDGWNVSPADVTPIAGEVMGAVDVDGPVRFKLVAVWAYLSGSPKVNPVIEALDAWSDWYADQPLVVAGDFNTGGQWTSKRRGPLSHYPIVDRLVDLGLQSTYHTHHGLAQGDHEEPTHWNSNGGAYTVDHIFAPKDWRPVNVLVGPERPWRHWSDHAPLLADLELGP